MKTSLNYKKSATVLLFSCSLLVVPLAVAGGTPSIPVLHLVNQAGEDIYNTLSASTPFVTDFKGSNDVTVTELAGSLDSDYVDTFGGADSFDNPPYITNFVGAATNGTGNGTVGDIEDIQTSYGLTLQFDFALRLTPQDRFFLIDCDNSEQYLVEAFVNTGSNYAQVSLVNWSVQNFAGSTEELPNSGFPVWNAATGVLASGGGALDEPLTVFTSDQPVDRLIVSQTASGGTASLQFVHPFADLGILGISPDGTNVQITVPTNSVVPSLQATTNLEPPIVWTTITTNATPGVIIVPISTNRQRFFRLFY